jgi:photosystem II stability/assembly factor-like uncharacterized protein
MKNSILFVLLFGMSLASASAQWVPQDSGTIETFLGVDFVDDHIGWAVGYDYENLYHTTDGGATWNTRNPGIMASFYDVSFCDAMNGVVTGSEGSILYTKDGGDTWTDAQYGFWLEYKGCHMLSPDMGAVAGSNTIFQPYVVATHDGWATLEHAVFYFEEGSTFVEGNLEAVHFIDGMNGIVVGRAWNGKGAICQTKDGGTTWSTIEWVDYDLNDVDFPTSQVGYVVGNAGLMLKSVDGGDTWTGLTSGVSDDLLGVSFPTVDTGYAVGRNGLILMTTDGGDTWTAESSGTTMTLNDVCFPDEDTGFAVGESGLILTKGGAVPSLLIDSKEVSVAGGTVNFDLIADAGNANRNYLLLGGVSGTMPGTPMPGGMVTLPLNWDALTDAILLSLGSPVFAGFIGQLDGSGYAQAQLNMVPVSPRYVGTVMHFAFVLNNPYDFASNAVEVKLVN